MCRDSDKRSVNELPAKKLDDFYWSNSDEPHATRRKLIREAHPEIDDLCGPDIRPVPLVLLIMASQFALAYFQQDWSWICFILVAWVYGGAASHSLSLMTHELSHNLVFKTTKYNEYFAIFVNTAMGFPSATRFKRYHMEHHQWQGDDEKDVDLPSSFEGRWFRSTFAKAVWVFLMPLTYSLRPQIIRPKQFRFIDHVNVYTIYASNALLFYLCGWRGWFYVVLSTVLGMGFHPCAGHFIAEHCVFVEGYETYSYYGPLNLLCWNVGYHNEHHDFPRVPGWKLPLVKKLAPEFYDNLPRHESWSYVIWRFITDPSITPFNRIRRGKNSDGSVRGSSTQPEAADFVTTDDTSTKKEN